MSNPIPIASMRPYIGALLCALCTVLSAHAGEDTLPPAELTRGMEGYGLSVFQGVQIDTFGVEILGVMEGAIGPGNDLILVRLSGANLEHTGIIRGMSGSPVYINGRLIGAIAYGWSYAKDPIGGVTPIGPMIDVAQRQRLAESAQPTRQSIDFSPPRWIEGADVPQRATLERLAMPVALAGFSGMASTVLQQALNPLGMEAVIGPGGQRTEAVDVPVTPGAGLGVQLISGDRSATAVGTLTWTDGERFVGFGHPMMHIGATDMPATSVYIHQVIPSQISSFKLGSTIRPFGTVHQDRLAGIGGRIGPAPDMVPVTVDIASSAASIQNRFAVMRHRDLTPALVRSVLLSAMEAHEKLSGDAALELRATLALSDGRRVEYEQFYSGPSAALIASIEAVQPLVAMAQSPFVGLDVDSVYIAADVRETLTQAHIVGMRLPAARLHIGQRYEAEVTLQPYRGESIQQRIAFRLPDDTPPGPISIRVSSGETARQAERSRNPGASVPRSADDLLKLVQQPGRTDELVLEIAQPQSGLAVHGRAFPSLPPSARSVLESESSAGYLSSVSERVLVRVRQSTSHALSGEHAVSAVAIPH